MVKCLQSLSWENLESWDFGDWAVKIANLTFMTPGDLITQFSPNLLYTIWNICPCNSYNPNIMSMNAPTQLVCPFAFYPYMIWRYCMTRMGSFWIGCQKNCSMMPEWHHAVSERGHPKWPIITKKHCKYHTSRYTPSAAELSVMALCKWSSLYSPLLC